MNLIKIAVWIILYSCICGADALTQTTPVNEPVPYSPIGIKVKDAAVLVGEASASSNASSWGETAGSAFDHSYSSKWCVADSSAWLQFKVTDATERAVIEYEITSANDVPERDPMDWQFQASNDGQNWVTLDTQAGQTFASRYQTNSYPVSNETVYAYYRLNVIANRGGSSQGLQLSELTLISRNLGESTSTAAGVVSASNDNSGESEKSASAFDQEPNTKWCIGDRSGWLQYQFTSGWEWAVSHYEITSANDVPGRDPMDWTLLGSNDGENWTVLDVQSGQMFNERHQTNGYTIPNTTAYTYYWLNVTANAGGSSHGLQLADLTLFSSSPPIKSCGKDGVVRSSYNNDSSNEGPASAFDGDIYTKWCIPRSSAWLRYQFINGAAWAVNQYQITSANDVPGRDPMAWQFQGSNDGQNWVTLDSQTGQSFASRYQTNSYPVVNEVPYIYYRLNVTANSGGSSQGLQLGELTLLSPAIQTASTMDGSISDSVNNGSLNEGPAFAFDQDANTKWCVPDSAAWLQYRFTHETWVVDHYEITSANDVPDRDPMDWTFLGSNDGIHWTTLDVKSGQLFAQRGQVNSYPIVNAASYSYYRLNVTANKGGSSHGIQIAELALFSSVAPVITDGDRDGMTDAWEISNGLNPYDASDAALDLDHDGVTNLQEYLANTDPAAVDPGLTAHYFDNTDFTGLKATEIDPGIHLETVNGKMNPALSRGACSVRWSGYIKPRYSENYHLSTRSNDGVRVWIDDKLVIDNWQKLGSLYADGSVPLDEGHPHRIVVEYFNAGGSGNVSLRWGSSSQAEEVVPASCLSPMIDSDSDGMPDTWEIANNLDPNNASDAALDPDHDDFTNVQEYQIGSSPTAPNPVPANLPQERGVVGKVLWERWSGPAFASTWIEDLRRVASYPAHPTETKLLDTFQVGPSQAVDDTGNRLRAYIVPKVSGPYQFFVTSNEHVTLSLSFSGKSTDRREICSGESIPANDWSHGSSVYYLQKGFRYYVELITRQPITWGTKVKSQFQVAWTTPEQSSPSLIPSQYLVSMGAEDDSDDDGLPDVWEQLYFGNLDEGPMGDPDRDGLTNAQEVSLKTSPTSGDSNENGITDAGEATGFLTYDYWFHLPGTSVSDFLGSPSYAQLPDGRIATNFANEVSPISLNSASILRGYVVPEVTGNYTFQNTATDWGFPPIVEKDWSAVYLSTDADPANKQLLVGLEEAPGTRALVAGQRYYIEIVHKIGSQPTAPARLLWKSDAQPWYSELPQNVLRPLDELGVPTQSALPSPWQRADIGLNRGWLAYPGYSAIHSDGSLEIKGAGVAIDRHADGTHLVYRQLAGDGEIRARISDHDLAFTYCAAGLMIRQGLGAGDRWAGLRLDYAHRIVFNSRTIQDGLTLSSEPIEHSGPAWLRMVRRGAWVYAYTSQDGARWVSSGQYNLGLTGPVYVGMFSASGSELEYGSADFDHIYSGPELSGAIGSNFVPDPTADQDDDGYSDAEETDELHSDPVVADLEPPATLALLSGNEATAVIGTWGFQGDTIYNDSVRGSIRFVVNVPEPGIYRLAIQGTPRRNPTADVSWFVVPSIDGQTLSRVRFDLQMGETGTVHVYTPWLAAGQHTVELYLDNVSINRSFSFTSLTLESIDGVDANENGIADWMESRLAAENTFSTTPVASRTSPYCLEGSSRYTATLNLTSNNTAIPVLPGIGNGWHAEVILDPSQASDVQASFENGALTQHRSIQWASTEVRLGETLKIRKGDSLLLQASVNASLTFSKDGGSQNTLQTDANGKLIHLFDTAGTYTLSAPDQSEVGPLTIQVIESQFSKPDPIVPLGHVRDWTNPALTLDTVVQTDSRMDIQELAQPQAGGRTFRLRMDAASPRVMLARLNDGTASGPILDTAQLGGLEVSSGTETGIYYVDQYPDGSRLVEMSVALSNVPADVRIKFDIFVAGVFFEDGSTVKWFTAADLDSSGMLNVRFLMAPGVSTSVCHRLYIYQGDTLLETRVN